MEIKKSEKTAVLIGATGLVGGSVLDLLLSHGAYKKVIVIARKIHEGIPLVKLDWIVNDFNDPNTYKDLIKGDDLFITLGTTLAKAGSKEAFEKIDKDLVFRIAQYGQMNGVKQLSLVSAAGADPDSMFFYNRVKGDLEEKIVELPFWATHIFQPSMLLGERMERRPIEAVGQWFSGVLNTVLGSKLGKYQPVYASAVAKSMVHYCQQLVPGVHFHPSHEIATFDPVKSIS